MKPNYLRRSPNRLRMGIIASSVLSTLTIGASDIALGQDSAEEIVVTGSRIVRRDFEANSPIVTVDSELFENSSTIAVESVLNQLPQFVPAVTQFTGGADVQSGVNNTVGATTIDLRGIGENRNLVLVNGKRAQPVNGLLVVDTNTIPSAAVERVEIVTGGASATYGPDAVSGVVNFILKNNFEGVEIDAQYGQSAEGDGSESRVSALFGAAFDGGRGNVMVGMEFFKRGRAMQEGRDFYERRNQDPTVGGTEFFFSDTYVSGLGADQAVVDGIFDQVPAGSVSGNTTFFLNEDGTLFTGGTNFGNGDASGAYRYNGPLGSFRKIRTDGSITETQQENFISYPQDRNSIFAYGNYDVTDDINIYAQANFAKTFNRTVLQYSPAVGGWSVSAPHGTGIYADSVGNADYQTGGAFGLNCAATGCTNSEAFPVPTELAALLDARTDPNADFTVNRVLDFIGPRSTENSNQTFQLLVGATGQIDAIDGTWDLYASNGETSVQNLLRGFGNYNNYEAIATSPNWGRGAAAGGAFGGGTASCTSGLPLFAEFDVSQDCIDAVRSNGTYTTTVDQTIIEGSVQGTLFEFDDRPVQFAAGASYRENSLQFIVSDVNSASNATARLIGQFASASAEGATEFKDIFAEVLIPVLGDVGLIESMNLELGIRNTDFERDDADTYKALVDVTFNEYARFRGGWQRANRAPNIGELFQPSNQSVVGTAFGDPCGTNTNAPFGANPVTNPSGSADAVALCSQIMGATGAATFYAAPQTGAPATITLVNESGNPALTPEEADTVTLGLVLQSPSDNAWLEGLNATIDWYEIEIADVIGPVSYDVVHEQCFSPAFNPSLDVNNSFCQQIVRDPVSGGGAPTRVGRSNVGTLKTSGIDLQINWTASLDDLGLDLPGGVGFNSQINILDEFLTQDLPGAPVDDSAGTGAQGGQFDYRVFSSFSYYNGPMSLNLRWRHYPGLDHASIVANPATTLEGTNAYDIFDFNGFVDFGDTYSVRFGIDNLLDTEPEIYGANPGVTTAAGSTFAGYYDTLGRRYYVGVKASF